MASAKFDTASRSGVTFALSASSARCTAAVMAGVMALTWSENFPRFTGGTSGNPMDDSLFSGKAPKARFT
jgi:hypothetical protein